MRKDARLTVDTLSRISRNGLGTVRRVHKVTQTISEVETSEAGDFAGRVWTFGDDVNTDEILPARYLNLSDPEALALHVMEDADPGFASRLNKGDILVAGKNFGCGSSREHAPVAIKVAGISCVIAKSFARIFFRNAYNTGLPILESSEAVDDLRDGDIATVSLGLGLISNHRSGKVFKVSAVPEFMRQLLKDGGLIPHIREKSAIR
jgi:3-isopropylmalate/(R)-2-methylmalate dehydratase small subunit